MAARRRTPAQPPTVPPSVSPQQGVGLLRKQQNSGRNILTERQISEDLFANWVAITEDYARKAFGDPSSGLSRFQRAGYSGSIMVDPSEAQVEERRSQTLQSKVAAIDGLIEMLETEAELESASPTPGSNSTLETLRVLFSRFNLVARQLRRRHESRATLDVSDEYDVQDLLHALLKIWFDDIRDEEWTPTYAGKASRMDFLLKPERTVIEVKCTRPRLSDRQIGTQLIEDIARYKVHPDCRTLVCFVYDPDGRITNPAALEHDLSRKEGQLEVEVLVFPRG